MNCPENFGPLQPLQLSQPPQPMQLGEAREAREARALFQPTQTQQIRPTEGLEGRPASAKCRPMAATSLPCPESAQQLTKAAQPKQNT